MLKHITTLFTSLALLTLLSSAALPHHHHKDWVHWVIDVVDDTNHCTSSAAHSHQENEPYSDCVFEKEYLSANQDDFTSTTIIKTQLAAPFFHTYQSYSLLEVNDLVLQQKYRDYIVPQLPFYVSFHQGLRGPPVRFI